VAIKGLFVDLFLEAHDRAPNEILDLDATDDPVKEAHANALGRNPHDYGYWPTPNRFDILRIQSPPSIMIE
jgi:hypothetical protein